MRKWGRLCAIVSKKVLTEKNPMPDEVCQYDYPVDQRSMLIGLYNRFPAAFAP
jgi:hypothetical protein